jgi:hypothetical protein
MDQNFKSDMGAAYGSSAGTSYFVKGLLRILCMPDADQSSDDQTSGLIRDQMKIPGNKKGRLAPP